MIARLIVVCGQKAEKRTRPIVVDNCLPFDTVPCGRLLRAWHNTRHCIAMSVRWRKHPRAEWTRKRTHECFTALLLTQLILADVFSRPSVEILLRKKIFYLILAFQWGIKKKREWTNMGPIRSKEAGCSATTGSGSAPTTKPYNVKRPERLRPASTVVESDSDEEEVQFLGDMGPSADRRNQRPHAGPSAGRSQRASSTSEKAKEESKGKGMAQLLTVTTHFSWVSNCSGFVFFSCVFQVPRRRTSQQVQQQQRLRWWTITRSWSCQEMPHPLISRNRKSFSCVFTLMLQHEIASLFILKRTSCVYRPSVGRHQQEEPLFFHDFLMKYGVRLSLVPMNLATDRVGLLFLVLMEDGRAGGEGTDALQVRPETNGPRALHCPNNLASKICF